MTIASSILATINPADDDNRRQGGRVPLESVQCGAGRVIDISGTGMRVRSKCELQGYVEAVLKGLGVSVTVLARVAWCKRVGFMKYEAGLRFVDLNDDARRALLSFTSMNRNCRSL